MDPEASRRPGTLRSIAGEAARVYRNLDKMDRWGGGGMALSSLVKLAGWAGLLVILGVLVLKMRELEDRLDPVNRGIERLEGQLEAARNTIALAADRATAQALRLEEESARLEQEAAQLERAVARARDAERGTVLALEKQAEQARTLLLQLQAQAGRAQEIGKRSEALAIQLDRAARAAEEGRSAMSSSSAKVGEEQRTLAASMKAASGNAQQLAAELNRTLAVAKAEKLDAYLVRAEKAAQDLSFLLERSVSRARGQQKKQQRGFNAGSN